MQPLHRSRPGEHFSEGSRLLWLALERLGHTQADAEAQLECAAGAVNRLLYGDRKPGRALGDRIAERYGVQVRAWDEEPKKRFVFPAARKTG